MTTLSYPEYETETKHSGRSEEQKIVCTRTQYVATGSDTHSKGNVSEHEGQVLFAQPECTTFRHDPQHNPPDRRDQHGGQQGDRAAVPKWLKQPV